MSHLTYAEAIVVGLFQGVTELFPVSSLGHSVLIPALIGGQWSRDLNVSAPESPYLAFIVGLHVATAVALLAHFWRDWLTIIRRLPSSPFGPAVGQARLRRGDADRIGAGPRAAARHQPLRRRHGRRPGPRPVSRGRREVLLPAGHPGDPRRRRAEDPRPDRAAGRRHRRPGPGRQPVLRHRRLPVGPLPGPLLPDPHPDPVRYLLHRGRAGQPRLPHPDLTTSPATPSPRRSSARLRA